MSSWSKAQRERFARQLLLAEVGERGQRKLCAAQVGARADGHQSARERARAYLTRAGVHWHDEDGELDVATPHAVRKTAGDPALEEAAAALHGAFAAVEAIKSIVGAGERASLPPDLTLGEETP